MATFSDKINKSIKEAMIAKDKIRLATLRDIKSKLILEATSGSGSEVSDEIATKICMKLYKQRKETHQLYIEQNREDLASEELAQASIIEEFLPKMLSEDEIISEVSEGHLQNIVNRLSCKTLVKKEPCIFKASIALNALHHIQIYNIYTNSNT